jgi:hypothetical protein
MQEAARRPFMSSPSNRGERTLIVDPQDLISVRDVMARWAYSEMVGAHFSPLYSTDPCVDAIKGKRSAGILFDQLSDMERNILFAEWSRVRSFFAQFLEGVRGYRIEQWHRHQLALARVTPGVDPKYRDYPLLSLFFLTSADHPTDPRNADQERNMVLVDDPLTLGLHNGDYVILDGLHRAKRFLSSNLSEAIPVYLPVPSASG